MSEDIKNYEYNRKDLKDIRASTLLPYGSGWEKPTPDEIRLLFEIGGELIGKAKLTGSIVGGITGADARSVRRWTAEEGSKGHKYISYAAWRLLLIYVGIVEPEKIELEQAVNIKNVAE